MINITFLGINILILILVWEKILKPSLLDHYRDKLFDLREEIREYYLSHGIGLNNNTYVHLRDLINAHLRFLEKTTFIEAFLFQLKIDKLNDLRSYIQMAIEKNFITKDKSLNSFIKNARERAVKIILHYMIFTSPLMITLLALTVIIYIPCLIMSSLTAKLKTKLKTKLKRIGYEAEKLSYESNLYKEDIIKAA